MLGMDRGVNLRAREAEKAATRVYDPLTGKTRPSPFSNPYLPQTYTNPDPGARTAAQNAYGPSGSQAAALATPRVQQFLKNFPPPSTRESNDLENTEAPAASPAPQPRAPLNWRDSAYNAQIASIQRALQDFETGAQTRGERYGQDFSTGLGRMGYRPGEGFQAMPNILEQLDQPQAMARGLSAGAEDGGAPAVAVPPISGSFDIEGKFDPYSAAARGTRSTRDEFAGRGTLRSSDFAKTFGEFQNRLNQQLEAMETARGRFGQDLATEVAQQRTQSQERQQAAQRDAMMRAAMAAAGGAGF
jgi:hypothetical protein